MLDEGIERGQGGVLDRVGQEMALGDGGGVQGGGEACELGDGVAHGGVAEGGGIHGGGCSDVGVAAGERARWDRAWGLQRPVECGAGRGTRERVRRA